jgi:adenylate cyclase
LAAFFLFSDRLAERKSYYLEQYGVAPIFKAGMHLGQVTATEVGNFKREIAYHGDAINIAARIQGQCSVFDKPYLISENVIQRIKNKELYSFNRLDEIILKGKTQPTTLFSVERNAS